MNNEKVNINEIEKYINEKRNKSKLKDETKSKKKIAPYKKKDIALSHEDIDQASFFKDELDELNKMKYDADVLYNELHELFLKTANEGRNSYSNKGLRDAVELSKSLVSAKALSVDIVMKSHSIKKVISDTEFKRIGDDSEVDAYVETARKIVSLIREQNVERFVEGKDSKVIRNITNEQIIESDEIDMLDDRLAKEIEDGSIPMSKHDLMIGVADDIEFRYDKRNEEFIAINRDTGDIIEGLPEDRYPKGIIQSINSDVVILSNGEKYGIL